MALLPITVLQTAGCKMETGEIKQDISRLSLVLLCVCLDVIFMIKLIFSSK